MDVDFDTALARIGWLPCLGGDPVLRKSLLLAGIRLGISLVWLSSYAYLVGRLGARLTRADVRRRLEQATGVVLVGLGLRLARERR